MNRKTIFTARLLLTGAVISQLHGSLLAADTVVTPASTAAATAEAAVTSPAVVTQPAAVKAAAAPVDTAAASMPIDPAAAKAAEKARAAQLAQWKHEYGDGPYPDEVDLYLASKPEGLRPYYKTLFVQGERNSVLNFERLGLAAMQTQNWHDAEHAFDAALSRIEAVYGKNKQAEAAKSVFRKESNKAFKGEPYERAMAYYYRGVLYLRVGDYDNARASFKEAEYQDTQSEQETYQSDFALLDYLSGWASQCGGEKGSAADAYATAVKANKDTIVPGADANALVIVEYGNGPVKAKDGAQREKLVFNKGADAAETSVSFQFADNGAFVPVAPISSLYTQATTRGGRAIDGILAGKANWKSGTADVGNAAMMGGLSMMNQAAGNANQAAMGAAGGYMALAGALFSFASSAMKADADTRYWDMLPDQIAVATVHAPTDPWTVKVRYDGAHGPIDQTPAAVMQSKAKTCSITWVRTHDVLTAPAEAPGDDHGVASSLAKRKDIATQNKQFRTTLASN